MLRLQLYSLYIPVYAINLPTRKERRKHLLSQFSNKKEFELKDIFTLWDAIFCTPDSQNGYGLVFLDYIALSMILRIRKQLLESDQNECFTTLFKYPTIENISELVSSLNSANAPTIIPVKILNKIKVTKLKKRTS